VTLARLLLAWLLVAIWFYVATILAEMVAALPLAPPLRWKVVEAGVLTLFASLWFDSLGSGQWWLVFLLVGVLATAPVQLVSSAHAPRRGLVFVRLELVELVRYLGAGALLAWRLS
jgi:hypothetical protein